MAACLKIVRPLSSLPLSAPLAFDETKKLLSSQESSFYKLHDLWLHYLTVVDLGRDQSCSFLGLHFPSNSYFTPSDSGNLPKSSPRTLSFKKPLINSCFRPLKSFIHHCTSHFAFQPLPIQVAYITPTATFCTLHS